MFGRRGTRDVASLAAYRSPAPTSESTLESTLAPGNDAGDGENRYRGETVDALAEALIKALSGRFDDNELLDMPRGELAETVERALAELAQLEPPLSAAESRDIVTATLNTLLIDAKAAKESTPAARRKHATEGAMAGAKATVQPLLMDRIDVSKANEVPRGQLAAEIGDLVGEILAEEGIHLNLIEQRDLVTSVLNDMLGLGPLEPLLADESINDILVNGASQVFIERKGKLELTDIQFRDNAHVMQIASRIVSAIGRRVDETTPLVDARLADGSRVNIIIPPLAIDGPSISIRKFSKKKITLDVMESQGNLSSPMATVLRIASRVRLNILISGGTGSGKTTLLNALSRLVDHGERIVTIEDAAELQLQQPHVVRLETRPANLEGDGEITQRELVKNALRMRPDRIILGEIRAGEALDMLQAMNTGHDGSMGTIHANRPREALTRLENMVAMAGVKLPNEAVRSQIAGAVNMIVQISRMRDGVRRITRVTEVIGMEGEVITTQDLFSFEYTGEDADGNLVGDYKSTGLRPHFTPRAQHFGLDRALLEAMG